jgi:hypothetical protein
MEIAYLEGEIFAPVRLNNEVYSYLISNRGRLISLKYKTPKLMAPTQEPGKCGRPGYLSTSLRTSDKSKYTSIRIHRLVAIMFIPNPLNLPQVNHIDGDKTNNTQTNLEWCDSLSNIRHSFSSGLNVAKKGVDSHMYGKGRKVILKGVIYDTITECARVNNIPRTSLCSELDGRMKTKVGISYVD